MGWGCPGAFGARGGVKAGGWRGAGREQEGLTESGGSAGATPGEEQGQEQAPSCPVRGGVGGAGQAGGTWELTVGHPKVEEQREASLEERGACSASARRSCPPGCSACSLGLCDSGGVMGGDELVARPFPSLGYGHQVFHALG